MKIDFDKLTIGQKLKIKRIAERLEQRELAKMLGIHVVILSAIENDRMDVPRKHYAKIIRYLES